MGTLASLGEAWRLSLTPTRWYVECRWWWLVVVHDVDGGIVVVEQTSDARLSPNNKELYSHTSDYCSTVQQVRAKAPFPTS